MVKWQYLSLFSSHELLPDELLDMYGEEGWELVNFAVVPHPEKGLRVFYIFRRPIIHQIPEK